MSIKSNEFTPHRILKISELTPWREVSWSTLLISIQKFKIRVPLIKETISEGTKYKIFFYQSKR
jgi:hypothetical protein